MPSRVGKTLLSYPTKDNQFEKSSIQVVDQFSHVTYSTFKLTDWKVDYNTSSIDFGFIRTFARFLHLWKKAIR